MLTLRVTITKEVSGAISVVLKSWAIRMLRLDTAGSWNYEAVMTAVLFGAVIWCAPPAPRTGGA